MLNQQEIWKDIKGYESLYQVSNLGRIKSKNEIINGINHKDYLVVWLYNKNRKKRYYVHRLVAFAFIDNFENKPFINHKNAVRSDNRINNLEWCTQAENMKHARDNNLIDYSKVRGINNPACKLTENQVIDIRNESDFGVTRSELSKKYGVTYQMIHRIIKRKAWRHI